MTRRLNIEQKLRHDFVQQVVAVLGEDRLGVELHTAVRRSGDRVDVAGRRIGRDPYSGSQVRGSGPPHKPAFDAVATVQIGGRQVRSASFRAGSKKEAERAAAAAMLADLDALPRRA